MRRVKSLLLIVLFSTPLLAQQTEPGTAINRPGPFDWIKKAPGDIKDFGKEAIQPENRRVAAWVIGSTAFLIYADQYLVDKAHNLGDHLGISHTNYQKTFFSTRVPGTSKDVGVEGPFDSGSTLYFIGDGWVDVAVAGSFLSYGLAKSDNRAIATASEMAESILASGAVVQGLKHITGRESPFTTQVPRGVWRFFPNQYTYARHVPEYDAFPSGHLCSAMAAVTVISDNYPEYRFIRPTGYTLMGVLGFQMMNNGVHWASDYPLALVMGYSFGKIAVRKGHKELSTEKTTQLVPMLIPGGVEVVSFHRFGGDKGDSSSTR